MTVRSAARARGSNLAAVAKQAAGAVAGQDERGTRAGLRDGRVQTCGRDCPSFGQSFVHGRKHLGQRAANRPRVARAQERIDHDTGFGNQAAQAGETGIIIRPDDLSDGGNQRISRCPALPSVGDGLMPSLLQQGASHQPIAAIVAGADEKENRPGEGGMFADGIGQCPASRGHHLFITETGGIGGLFHRHHLGDADDFHDWARG